MKFDLNACLVAIYAITIEWNRHRGMQQSKWSEHVVFIFSVFQRTRQSIAMFITSSIYAL